MEFELTIRGNTDELPPLLELFRENGDILKVSGGLNLTGPEIPTISPWPEELQQSLWNELSPTARNLMIHLAMHCNDDGNLYNPWICNPDGDGHEAIPEIDGERGYCPIGVLCEDPARHRYEALLPFQSGINPESCGISAQSLGARLANVARNFSDPKYRGLADPIIKYRDAYSGQGGHSYKLQVNWPEFIAKQWEIVWSVYETLSEPLDETSS